MSTTDSYAPELAARAREITEVEKASYVARTPRSQAATQRARRSLPLGVPSSFQAYDPHPVVAKRAQAAWLEDVDGNHYVDFNMGFGALFAGHCHPKVRAAIEEQLDDGTLFVTPCEANADVAELLAERYGLPMWRFTNSGTEATMDAIRVARGRDRAGQARQGRGRLPRPPRRGDDLDEAAGVRGRSGRRAERRPRHRGHHPSGARRHDRHPLQRPRGARAGAAGRRRRLLHRRAGDGEHRHLPARARLPARRCGRSPDATARS